MATRSADDLGRPVDVTIATALRDSIRTIANPLYAMEPARLRMSDGIQLNYTINYTE
jgi:hypothetical protein